MITSRDNLFAIRHIKRTEGRKIECFLALEKKKHVWETNAEEIYEIKLNSKQADELLRIIAKTSGVKYAPSR